MRTPTLSGSLGDRAAELGARQAGDGGGVGVRELHTRHGAWPGDAAKLLTSGQIAARQVTRLQNTAHAPALADLMLALRASLAQGCACSLLVGLSSSR